jgi:hypothetical protein
MIRFQDELCECEHPATVHDDGFGCTEPGCPCLAQWELDQLTLYP